jgi:hypothetical protein
MRKSLHTQSGSHPDLITHYRVETFISISLQYNNGSI